MIPILTLLTMTVLDIEGAVHCQIKRLGKNPGLYYKKSGTLLFESADWKIATHADIVEILQNSAGQMNFDILTKCQERMLHPLRPAPVQCQVVVYEVKNVTLYPDCEKFKNSTS